MYPLIPPTTGLEGGLQLTVIQQISADLKEHRVLKEHQLLRVVKVGLQEC